MGALFLSLVALWARAAEPPAPAGPSVTINLGSRQASGTPSREGFCHTGGGNIDVAQPSPDTLVVTMTGVAVAGAHPVKESLAALTFDLWQDFEVQFARPELKKARLSVEAKVVGLLRSHPGGGSAQINCPAQAAVVFGGTPVVQVSLPTRCVAHGDNLSINDQQGPMSVEVVPGKYTLRQAFAIQAAHPKRLLPCKAASAEFAPDPALDPLWISAFEPFHGAIKKSFGFQVTLKVSAD
jgi:hypothetical protein